MRLADVAPGLHSSELLEWASELLAWNLIERKLRHRVVGLFAVND